MPGSFLDTNMVVYSIGGDPAKMAIADRIVSQGGAISVQVLNEFANVARRKMRLSWQETHRFLDIIKALLVVHDLTKDVHETGLFIAERYGLSIYDAMIAASALHADCDILWSEDLQHGLMIQRRLQVINPFLAST